MIIRFNDSEFNKIWDYEINKYVLSPYYSSAKQNFYNQRPKDKGTYIKNKSFIVLENRNFIGGFCGSLVKNENKIDLLAGEEPSIVFFNNSSITKKIEKEFLDEIDSILTEVSGEVHFRDQINFNEINFISRHLLKNNAQAFPRFSKNIDLTKDEVSIRADLRRRYKHSINWGLKSIDIQIQDKHKIKWETIEEFRRLHIEASGRETRSIDSWKRQFEMVQKDEAFAVLGYMKNQMVAAGLFLTSKNNCFYGSSASKRELFDKPIFHSLMWTAILNAKKLGCLIFEIGEQDFPNHSFRKIPSKKELDISDFKSGFGGSCKVFIDILLRK